MRELGPIDGKGLADCDKLLRRIDHFVRGPWLHWKPTPRSQTEPCHRHCEEVLEWHPTKQSRVAWGIASSPALVDFLAMTDVEGAIRSLK